MSTGGVSIKLTACLVTPASSAIRWKELPSILRSSISSRDRLDDVKSLVLYGNVHLDA